MSNGVKTWCFVLLLPILLALGHDFYASYANTPEKVEQLESMAVEPEGFMISDLGYLFFTYTPEGFDAAKAATDPAIWDSFINPVLELPTYVVVGIPAMVFFIYLSIAWIFGLSPFERGSTKKADKLDRFGKSKSSGFKYNRK